MPREAILSDLDTSQPGNEGKWSAAAKDAGFFELAIELANRCSSDLRTLIADAREFAGERPVCPGGGHDRTARYRQWMGRRHHWRGFAECVRGRAAAGAAGVDETVVNADWSGDYCDQQGRGRVCQAGVGPAAG